LGSKLIVLPKLNQNRSDPAISTHPPDARTTPAVRRRPTSRGAPLMCSAGGGLLRWRRAARPSR